MIPNRDMITAWHRHASISSPGVAVVASRRENPVQVVLAGPQVASWTHAGLHLGLQLTSVADVPARSALRSSSSGDLVVLPTRRRISDRVLPVTAPLT